MAGAEHLEVGVACPVVAGCDGDSWDYLTDRAGLRAALDGHPASAICVEHGGTVPAGPVAPLGAIDDYLDRWPPEATARALQRVLHGVSQTQPAAERLGTALDGPGDPTGTATGTPP